MVAVRFQTLISPVLRICRPRNQHQPSHHFFFQCTLVLNLHPNRPKENLVSLSAAVSGSDEIYVSIGILPCARNRWQFRLGQLMAYDLFCGDLAYDTITCTFKKPTRPIQWRPRGHEVDSTRTPRDYHIALGLPFYDYSFYCSVRLIVKYMYEKKKYNN